MQGLLSLLVQCPPSSVGPGTDQPHCPRPPNHLPYPSLVPPRQPSLGSRLDHSHVGNKLGHKLRVDALSEWVNR